jgi:membrane protein YdbS with pleckstrin-like domain
MSDHQLQVLNISGYVCEWLGIALVLFFPLRSLFAREDLKRAVLQMWAYFFAWSIALCFVFPVTIASIFHDKRAYDCFPEMTGIVAVAILGLIPSFVICGLVWLVKSVFSQKRSQ